MAGGRCPPSRMAGRGCCQMEGGLIMHQVPEIGAAAGDKHTAEESPRRPEGALRAARQSGHDCGMRLFRISDFGFQIERQRPTGGL